MLQKLRQIIADNGQKNSWASQSRQKRFAFFKSLIAPLPKPVSVLDVGGTYEFWKMMDFTDPQEVTITLLNLNPLPSSYQFTSIQGDATDMKMLQENQFDVVFSNSLIEHLFTKENQQKMAREVKRVGKNYFIQTPNYWFPVEPHYLFPFFQYLPFTTRVWLVRNYQLGHIPKARNLAQAEDLVREVKLLSVKEMKKLFPEGKIYYDKFAGLTKSIVAYRF